MGLQTVDYGAWLLQQADPADFVVVAMDLGAGRGFEVLQGMLSDGSLALVDQLHVWWRYQLSVRCHSRASPGASQGVVMLTPGQVQPLKLDAVLQGQYVFNKHGLGSSKIRGFIANLRLALYRSEVQFGSRKFAPLSRIIVERDSPYRIYAIAASAETVLAARALDQASS